MATLKRFWFTFKKPPQFSPFGIGCGVTAFDYADALNILSAKVFVKASMPEIESVVSDVDLQALDPHHVLPNIGVVTNRGVWFPLGY